MKQIDHMEKDGATKILLQARLQPKAMAKLLEEEILELKLILDPKLDTKLKDRAIVVIQDQREDLEDKDRHNKT